MKKLIAILLSFAIAFTLGIPAFAAEEESETPRITQEEILDIVASEEFKETLEEEGYDVEEFEEKMENGDYEIIEDSEDPLTYKDRFAFVMKLSDDLFTLSISSFVMSGTMGLVFPGLIIITLPLGVFLFVMGTGTIIASPVIALIFSEDYIRESSYGF